MKYRYLPHTADIKFQAFGNDLEEVFENSAFALINIICKDKIKEVKKKKIKIEGHDMENLLYEFLEEFLFLFDSDGFILSKIKNLKIEVDDGKKEYKLECEIFGDVADNYEVESHVKAITYNEMFVKQVEGKWISQVVVDV